ncbi:Membrane dipeptidase [Hymenobacter roseosalivarius DSM 11622]|uniref:Membrane dipeptidase n=1 Tax=Hymenobacter roseosalivarius DSM 11622 TaxID=645990 RepID=A0A1W1VCQ4_9BACT|nr:dipeptidase [Hymenobacter roseosalivarius]SMB91179.1 Membrane dipeptidase [Hymenobacter roseosalivarius DSM 11622]
MPNCYVAVLLLLVTIISASASAQTGTKQQAKARKLHERLYTVDSHEDTPSNSLLKSGFDLTQDHNPDSAQVDLPKMRRGGLDAAFWVVYLGQGPRSVEGTSIARQQAQAMFSGIEKAVKTHPTELAMATTPAEALSLGKAGKRAIFIGMENGFPVGRDLSQVQAYYDQGVRYLTLCHSSNNEICDSATDPKGPEYQGLSPFGEQVVAEMNRLGMMVDVSHTSDSTFYDVLRLSRVPVIASHSSCRALADMPRNLSDDMLRALARNGGVIQINFFSPYVKNEAKSPERVAAEQAFFSKWQIKTSLNVYGLPAESQKEALAELKQLQVRYPVPLATLQDAANQIDHAVKMAGINHVGIGSDFDGGSVLTGLRDVGDLPSLTAELMRRGYSRRDLAKIWSGNLFRVMKAVEKGKSRPATALVSTP